MTRKLVNIKNILRIIISCFVIVNMLKSCAKAYTFSDFSNFVDQVQGQSTNSNYVNQLVNAFKGSKNAILTTLANNNKSASNYTYFAIKLGRSGSLIDFYLATNDIVTFLPSGNYGSVKYDPYGLSIRLSYSNNNWTATLLNTSEQWHSNQGCSAFIGLNKTANYSGNWQNATYNKVYWWVEGDYNPITYLQYNTDITDNTHNGSLFTYYYQGNLYGQNELKLGDITINDSYYYEVRLRNSNTNVVVGTIFYDVNTNNTYNDGAIYQDNNKNIYVTTRLLNYSTQYQLEVESYYGDGGTNLYEDIDWYIFLPVNASISGDQIVDFGSGEFNQQDATNAIIDNQNQNNNEIINSINNIVGNLPAALSGDNSGDASGDLSSGFDGGGGILGGIFSLFVPDGQFFKEYFEDLNNWFADRLGLLYFPIELTIDFLSRCLNIDFTQQVLSIGPYVMPLNDNFELVPGIEIDFNSFLEDETVNSIHEVYLFITDGLIIFGLYRLIIKKYNNIVKNKGGG